MSTAPIQSSSTAKRGGAFAAFIVSRELRLWYYAFVAFVVLVGLGLIYVGWRKARDFVQYGTTLDAGRYRELRADALEGAIVWTSLGVLVFLAGISLLQIRRYLVRVRATGEEVVDRAELNDLAERDFESFDRVRRLREKKDRHDFEKNVQATIALRHLRATDMLLFPEVKWEIKPALNVLLGRNGYGKSLLLRAVAGLLQRDEEATQPLIHGSASTLIELGLTRDGDDVVVRWDRERFSEAIGKVPLLAIPDSRFVDRTQQILHAPDDSDRDLLALGAHAFLHQRQFGTEIQNLLYGLCLDYFEHGRSFKIPSFRFLEQCVGRLTGFDLRFDSISRVGSAGFEIFVRTEGNEGALPIRYASQGTLSAIAMFGLIRSYLAALADARGDEDVEKTPAIVLIDEADAHLHPAWQQKVPGMLRDLFPNVQFIITAHSPLFVAGCWSGEVAVLRRSESGGFALQQIERDFVGARSDELYREIFEIEELDDTYLEYATKATQQTSIGARIEKLVERHEKQRLSAEEEAELLHLQEESSRVRRAIQVREQRQEEYEKDAQIDKLESEVLELKVRLSEMPGGQS